MKARQAAGALQSAARLAAEMSAEILAIFIEDADLFSVAALPGHFVVSFQGGDVAPLDEAALYARLRVRERRLREDVARIAGINRVAWKFQIARGRVRDEILARAHSCEMIAIGASSVHHRRLGRNAGAILEQASCSVIVFHERARPSPRVALVSENPYAREIAAESRAHDRCASFRGSRARKSAKGIRSADAHGAQSMCVTDRAALAKLGMSPQALASALDLRGFADCRLRKLVNLMLPGEAGGI